MGRFLNKVAQKVSTFKDKFNNVITWPEIEKFEAPAKSVTPSHFSHGVSPIKSKTTKPYIGVPAPDITPYDPWFTAPIKSDKQIVLEEKKKQAKKQQEEVEAAMTQSREPKNIHDVLYKKATSHMKNSWQENIGGSENYHEGPGGWKSGTGQNQFR
jgi:hypothetical protein